MSPISSQSNLETKRAMAVRLLAALELMDFSIALMRQNIARKLPGVTPEKVTSELRRWLIDQPRHFVVRDSTSSEAP